MNREIVEFTKQLAGTKFKHGGRNPRMGLDCLGVIMCVAMQFKLRTSKTRLAITDLDRVNYELFNFNHEMMQVLEENFEAEQSIQECSIALFKFDKFSMHLGIIVDHPNYEFGLVHADLSRRMVVYHGLTDLYRDKIVATYNLTTKIE